MLRRVGLASFGIELELLGKRTMDPRKRNFLRYRIILVSLAMNRNSSRYAGNKPIMVTRFGLPSIGRSCACSRTDDFWIEGQNEGRCDRVESSSPPVDGVLIEKEAEKMYL
jgi:hypothetical protein